MINMGATPPSTYSGAGNSFGGVTASAVTIHVPSGTDITSTGTGTWATWRDTYLSGAALVADL
jgi:hypothetical protein